MNISQNCTQLIKKWEGCKLEAYRDPVGIPTIGYGTIAYPDGTAVAMGDHISQEQAEGFLMHECAGIAPRIDRLVTVTLHQNQFDALVSFAYNVGVGAFADSTLLKKLNQSDYAGAAAEFPRWNKGEVNGQKVELPGLTNRRRDERALFESTQGGGAPVEIDLSPTPQQQVTWLEAYLEGNNTVIVAWKGSEVVEMITLESKAKRLLIDVLNQYPKAATVAIAPSGKPLPSGPRVTISDPKPAATPAAPATAPPPPSDILARGSKGEEVKVLQDRLKDLGYYKKDIDGDFGSGTDAAVRAFQSDVFGSAEADGKVGPKTWAKLWETSAPPPVNPTPGVPGKNYLRLTKTQRRDRHGLCVLMLDYIKNGAVVGSLEVCSGANTAQVFRIGSRSRAGSMEPLPEGRWKIHTIAWFENRRDVYGPGVFASGLGPVSTPLDYVGPGSTERGNIEIHIDWNVSQFPGTAGCIGIRNVSDYKVLVQWLRDTDPQDLFVDWGLGTCPHP
jgi:lysozyme